MEGMGEDGVYEDRMDMGEMGDMADDGQQEMVNDDDEIPNLLTQEQFLQMSE